MFGSRSPGDKLPLTSILVPNALWQSTIIRENRKPIVASSVIMKPSSRFAASPLGPLVIGRRISFMNPSVAHYSFAVFCSIFVAGIAAAQPKTDVQVLKERFKQLDKNGDDKITT